MIGALPDLQMAEAISAHDESQCRMTSLAYGLGTASWDYLANGLIARQTLPNGAWTDYAYDGANRIRQLINKDPSGTALAAYGDTEYLPTGDLAAWTAEVTGQANQSGAIAYDYDSKRRLIEEASTRLGGYDYDNTFDDAGNALEFRNDPHTYNADNQLVGPGTYVYDGNGNPTTWDGTGLTWNVENRMTAYGTALTAGYRGDGLRAWKQPGGGNKTYFLYDGISVLCELDNTGAVSASSTYGANGLLSRGTTEYQFDPLGDAVLLMDGTGAVTARQVFDGWGNALMAATGPYGYRAERNYFTDLETGLIALGFRLYSTDAGRLLQRDPIGLAIGANQYWYADANPVLHIDPLGLLSDLGTVVILGLVGAAAAAITDFCLQQLRCPNTDLDWASIGISAVGGLLAGLGFGPSVIGAVGAAALNFIVAASRCGNIVANGGCFAEAGDAAFRSIIAGIGAGIVAEIAKALGKSGIAAIWGIVDILIGMTVACAGLLPWMQAALLCEREKVNHVRVPHRLDHTDIQRDLHRFHSDAIHLTSRVLSVDGNCAASILLLVADTCALYNLSRICHNTCQHIRHIGASAVDLEMFLERCPISGFGVATHHPARANHTTPAS